MWRSLLALALAAVALAGVAAVPGPSLTVVPAQTVLGINQKTDVTVALDNTLGPLNNAVVTITLGAALTGSVDAGSPCTQTGQVITCPGTIAATSTSTFVIKDVSSATPGSGGSYSIDASATWDGLGTPITGTAGLTVQNMQVVMSTIASPVFPSAAGAGFEITITNTGTSDVTAARFAKDFAAIFSDTAASDTNACTVSGGCVICTWATIAPGESKTVTVTGTAPSSTGAYPISMTTTTTSGSPVTTEATLEVVALGVNKIVDDPTPDPSDPLVYTIGVQNGGTTSLTGVELADDVSFLTGTVAVDDTTNCAIGGAPMQLTCFWPQLAAGEIVTLTLTGNAPNTPGSFDNTATVAANGVSAQSSTASIVVQAPPAVLELTKAAEPASVLPGQLITFTLTADTSGNDARGVLLTDTLPAGLTLVSAPSECTAVNPVVCTIPDLLVGGEPYEIVITAIAATPGTYVNSATLTADNQAGPVTETAAVTVTPPPSPILSLVKVADPVVVLNQDFTYALLATAAGGDVSGVTLVDTMPAGVKAVAVAPEECQLDTRVNSVTCSWATLEVGAPKLVLINAMANNAGEIVNTAELSATDAQSASASATISAVVPGAELTLTKEGPAEVSCGQRFVFTLTAAVAVQDVTDALVVDVFPEGVVPLAVSPQAFCDVDNINQQVLCQFPLMVAGGAPVVIEIVAVADKEGAYINEATLVAEGAVAVTADAALVAVSRCNVHHCLECHARHPGYCEVCEEGYQRNKRGECRARPNPRPLSRCQRKHPHCARCSRDKALRRCLACHNGYRLVKGRCLKARKPVKKCRKGRRLVKGRCIKVVRPVHKHKCRKGFRSIRGRCVRVTKRY